MNKENFKKRAKETKSNKCIHFDWTNNPNDCCCLDEAPHNPSFCIMFSLGAKCNYYSEGV